MDKKDAINRLNVLIERGHTKTNEAIKMAVDALNNDVVRCRECKYWVPDEVGVVEEPLCTRLGYEKLTGLDLRIGSANDYCSFGERREG